MSEFLADYKRVGALKKERWQSLQLIQFTHTRVCIVPGCKKPATAHHAIRGRRGISSDALLVPLCDDHHTILDGYTKDREFEDRFNVNLAYEAVVNIELFFDANGLSDQYKVDHKTVARGTAKSKGTQQSRLAPLKNKFIPLKDRPELW